MLKWSKARRSNFLRFLLAYAVMCGFLASVIVVMHHITKPADGVVVGQAVRWE